MMQLNLKTHLKGLSHSGFILLACIFLSLPLKAFEPSKIEILEDPSKQLTIEDVQKSNQWAHFSGSPVLGYTSSRFWVRFQFSPRLATEFSKYILKIPYTYLGQATLYEFKNGNLVQQQTLGMGVALAANSDAPLVSGSIVFPLSNQNYSDMTYLLSAEGHFPLAVPMEIVSDGQLQNEQGLRQFLLGIFFGILALAALFNAFLGLWLKDRIYILYSLFNFSAFFLFFAHERLSIQLLWPQSPNWSLYEMHASGGLVVLFYALFVRHFLQTKKRTPWLDRFLLGLVLISSIRSVWLFFEHNLIVAMVGEAAIVLSNLLILTITALYLWKRVRAARYFFIASFLYNFASVLFILNAANVVHLSSWIEYAPHLGIISEVILLSIAMADRIRFNNFQLENTIQKLDSEIQRRQQTEEKMQNHQLEILQAEKMSALGRMGAGIAHEINNPLAIISSYAEHLGTLCSKDPLPLEKIKEIGPKIEATVQRISRIIKSMRTLARDASSDPFVKISLSTIFQDIQSLCHERYRHNGIELIVTPVSSDVSILGRSPEICQVLVNLLNNAFDAVQKQELKFVQVDWQIQKDDIFISVSNNGPLIPMDLQNKIYEPFFTTKQIGQGTGLGLSISKTLVENHGGQMWVETRNQKTCFVFSLPRWVDGPPLSDSQIESRA